jgi:hypothetical protein
VKNAEAARHSAVAVELGCGTTAESLLENGGNGLRLEVSGREDTTVGSWACVAARERERPDDRTPSPQHFPN